ncbi:unnamed protein product [Ixodes hexagonus]
MGMGPVFRHCPCLRPAREEVRVLDYAHCGLEEVPSEVFNYERTLEELYLNANQIKDLPRPLFHCHGLRKLNLSDNDIQTLPPALSSLISLEELDISKNNVIEIPDNIKGCKCLSIVEASVNPVGKLPEGFTQLINIEQLYLNDTFLEFLPANFGRLSKLKILELRENHLKVLPKSMARLTELVRLDIGQNDFAELPEVIGSLPSLTELWCDSNRLTALPSYLGNLTKLTYLDASRNRISYVAEEIEHLVVLSDLTLTANKLQKVPETLGSCLQSLTTLRLDDNHLATLPDSIGQLSKLEELIINGNEIDSLPSTVGLLRSLSILIADDNLLEDLPPEIGSCGKLRVLSLRDNRLCNVPDELGHLGALRVVNLSGNQLRHLPVSLAKLGGLHALWLSQNQTKPLVLLQSDLDRETGQRVLTCFLLPQESPSAHGEKPDVVEDDSSVVPGERRGTITFAFDVDIDRPGRLVRSPTPYPKELKARARHVRNLRRQMNGDVVGPGAVVVSQPTSRIEGFGRPETAPLEQMPDPPVREAKVVQPSPPATQDLAQVHVDTHDLTIRHRDASLATAEEYACRQASHNMFTTTNNNIAMCADLETVKSLASQPCQSPPLSSIVARNPAPSPDLHQLHHQHLQQHTAAHQQDQQHQLLLLQQQEQQQAHHHPAQPHAATHHLHTASMAGHQYQTLPRHQMPHRSSPQQQHQVSWEDSQRQYEHGIDMAFQHHEQQHPAKTHPHLHPFEMFAIAGSRGSLVEKFQHRLVVSAEDSVDQQGYKSDQETYVQQPGKSGAPTRAYHDGYSSDWDASATLPRGFSLSRAPDVVPGFFRPAPASPGRTLPRRGSSPVSPRMCVRSPRKMAAFAVQAPHPLKPAPAVLEGAAEGAAPFLLPQYCGDLRTSKEGYSLPVRRGAPPPSDWAPQERLAPRAEDEDLAPSQSSSSLASSVCVPSEDMSLSSLNSSVTPDSGQSPTTPCFKVPEEEEEEEAEEEAPPLPPRPRGDCSGAPVPPPKPDFLLQRSVSSRSADHPLVQSEVVLERGSEVDFVLENRSSVPGVFVKEVNPHGVAAGKLEVGDKILRVDGLDVSSAEVNYALGALVSSGPKVRLIFARHQ